jgi:hypothetical protein
MCRHEQLASTHHFQVAISTLIMSSISSTSTLASWDPKELFQLVNPDKMSITCVGYAPSCRRRCRNPIAYHNVQAAKEVMRQVVRSGISNTDLKEMLFNLAGYTLCRRYHQGQATVVSDRWFGMVQRYRDEEDDRGSDTSDDDDDGDSDDGASSTGSSSEDSDDDDNDNAPRRRVTGDAEELRRRFDELETLQREFEELLQRQRQSLQDRMSRSSLTGQRRLSQENRRPGSELIRDSTTRERTNQDDPRRNAEQARQQADYIAAQHARETAREQRRRDRAEQAKREEAQFEAEAKAKAQQEAKAKAKATAEAERLRKEEQEAEKARLHRERQAKDKMEQQSRILSWESAWLRYEAAWAEFTPNTNNRSINADIRTIQIWPTKSGSFVSCCEEDVRAFFICHPGDFNRRVLRRQALRWHPDRAARLFACVADELVVGEVLRTVTMISQVVIGIMGVAAR